MATIPKSIESKKEKEKPSGENLPVYYGFAIYFAISFRSARGLHQLCKWLPSQHCECLDLSSSFSFFSPHIINHTNVSDRGDGKSYNKTSSFNYEICLVIPTLPKLLRFGGLMMCCLLGLVKSLMLAQSLIQKSIHHLISALQP